jgi:hypothetical protein
VHPTEQRFFLAVRILESYYLDLNARRVLRPSFRHDHDEPMVGPLVETAAQAGRFR